MSNINDIMERIATIQKTVSITDGINTSTVKQAEAYQPSDISSVSCPFFINEIHGGRTEFMATGGLQYVDNNISMNLCVMRREAGTNLKNVVKQTEKWRDAVFIAFAQKLRLGNDFPFIIDAYITSWDLIEYTYGTTAFVALNFNLFVREAFTLTVAP